MRVDLVLTRGHTLAPVIGWGKVDRLTRHGAVGLLLATILLGAWRAFAIPPASLPGDVDCDGLVTSADLDQLRDEITDGDGDLASDVHGGAVGSCSGADANGDGLITAADLSALTRLLYGETDSVGPLI